jgi:hypothetical protein
MFNKQIPSTLPINTSTTCTSLVSRWGDSALRMSLALCAFLFFSTFADARPAQYVRPYSPNAPWNVPVTNLPKHPESATYVSRFWSGSSNGDFNLRFTDYTYPVYYVSDATTTATVSASNGNMNGKTIPFNPAWTAAPGSDAQMIILDPSNGYEYNFWQFTGFSGGVAHFTTGNLIQKGTAAGSGNPASYLTKEDGYAPCRGVGIQQLAMLVQPEEVALGVIRHGLSMPITNPDGSTYVAPATKVEHPGSGTGVPEGMRFAIDVTDAEINAWVATKPAAYQKLARTVAVALRDYGWFITDTSGADGWQMESAESADALWRAQGIVPGPGTAPNLMDGLVTQSRIYAIVPSDQYPNQSLAPPNPPTGLIVN